MGRRSPCRPNVLTQSRSFDTPTASLSHSDHRPDVVTCGRLDSGCSSFLPKRTGAAGNRTYRRRRAGGKWAANMTWAKPADRVVRSLAWFSGWLVLVGSCRRGSGGVEGFVLVGEGVPWLVSCRRGMFGPGCSGLRSIRVSPAQGLVLTAATAGPIVRAASTARTSSSAHCRGSR